MSSGQQEEEEEEGGGNPVPQAWDPSTTFTQPHLTEHIMNFVAHFMENDG